MAYWWIIQLVSGEAESVRGRTLLVLSLRVAALRGEGDLLVLANGVKPPYHHSGRAWVGGGVPSSLAAGGAWPSLGETPLELLDHQ